MATLKDIGLELGLSVATVSRALNNFPEVKKGTKEKVRDTANRLGYKPNRIAQRLVTGRSGMVGMVVKIRPDMSADQTFFEMLTGLTAALAARDTDLVLAVDSGDDPIQPFKKLLERDILDGFILNAPVTDDPRVPYLQKRGIPFVLHGQTKAGAAYPFFDIDNRAVCADAVAHLTGLGHRRIALMNAQIRYAYAVDRRDGFLIAMAAKQLPVPSEFVVADTENEADAYDQAITMLSRVDVPRPTAIVCASTLIAAGVMRAANDAGLSVPSDLSVVAHDDALPLMRAVNFDPALTVTRAPLRDACVPVANLLVDHLGGASVADSQTMIKADLIVRQSSGPVPKGETAPWPST